MVFHLLKSLWPVIAFQVNYSNMTMKAYTLASFTVHPSGLFELLRWAFKLVARNQ